MTRALLVVALVAAAGLGTLAATRTETTPAARNADLASALAGRGITASARAQPPATLATDVVSVVASRDLASGIATAALDASAQGGAAAVITEGATLGLTKVFRGSQLVQATAPGYRFGMSTSAVSTDAVGNIMGRPLAAILAANQVIMGSTAASLHGAQAGDVLELLNAANQPVRVLVGLVAADSTVGGTEILMSPELFHAMGFLRPTRVLMWGIPDRNRLNAAMAANGLARSDVRIIRSWDPPSPDGTLSTATTKARLGEFSYSYTGSGANINPDAAWRDASIARFSWPVGGGSVNTSCHRVVDPAARAALAEVSARGLAGAIDLANTNTYGGCYGPREVRPAGGTTGGSVSRHSWGQAIDMNTVSNCLGCVPRMNCTVVQIFRKYGFAWGGNFLTPDGMHFEWVGERRDLQPSPYGYCPNVPGATQSIPQGLDGLSTLVPDAPAEPDSRHLLLAETSPGDADTES
jgi:hypothetical protein